MWNQVRGVGLTMLALRTLEVNVTLKPQEEVGFESVINHLETETETEMSGSRSPAGHVPGRVGEGACSLLCTGVKGRDT